MFEPSTVLGCHPRALDAAFGYWRKLAFLKSAYIWTSTVVNPQASVNYPETPD